MTAIQEKPVVKTYRDLIVYQKSFELAMEVFRSTAGFPREERYNLTDQMRRASRSIPLNIAEGWAKRRYENVFKRHLIDSIGSCEEMKACFDFARECQYIENDLHQGYLSQYDEVGMMLQSLFDTWVTY